MFLELSMVRAREDQCNSAYWNSGSKTVVHSEGCWRYANLQWCFAASGKLKFSSAISFPVNIKAMSVDIWEQRLCSWGLFFPLPCCFVASISLPALSGRGSKERGMTAPQPLGEGVSLLQPDAFLCSLQMWVHGACRLTPRLAWGLNTVLQVDLRCLFILYCMVQSFCVYTGKTASQTLISCPGPSSASCTAKQISLSRPQFLSSIILYVLMCVHLGHRGTSFKSCKIALTSRDWE